MKALLLHNLTFKSTMKRHILVIILAFGMSGCAAWTKPGGFFYPYGQRAKLSQATTLLKQGDSSAAAGVLQDICAEPAVSGVTDEALFLLTILRLGSDMGSNRIAQAHYDLEQLVTDYPTSSWSPLASSLAGFLASVDERRQHEDMLIERNLSLEQENKELKGISITQTKELNAVKDSNLSLTKENSRLREIIEKLKNEKLKLSDIIEQLKNLDVELSRRERSEPGVSPH